MIGRALMMLNTDAAAVISVSCFGRVVVLYAQRNVVFTLSLSDSHMNCISLFFIKISLKISFT